MTGAPTQMKKKMRVDVACRDLDELNPDFRAILEKALAAAKEAGLEPLVTETYRSQERQDYLYEQGRSTPGKIVTNTRNSKHISRLAADVCPTVGGRIFWDRKDLFDQWGEIAEAAGLVWGGKFSAYDGPHVQASWA